MTIKMKFLTLATLALTLGLTSCSNDKENEAISAGSNKNVHVKIEKPRDLTRAESNPEAGGNVVDFHGGYLYFTASNGFIEKYVEIITSGDPSEDQILIDDLNKGKDFTNLPAATAKVYVVGNTEVAKKPILIREVINKALTVDSQKDFKNVNLYGDGDLTPKVGELNKYEAKVTLAPTVSRLEIGQIKSKGDGIKSFNMEGIFVDNYISQSDVEGLVDPQNVMKGLDIADNFKFNSVFFPESLDTIVYDWYGKKTDEKESNDNILSSIKDGDYQTVKPTGNNSIWAYNVFATGRNIVPRIVIRLTDVSYSNGVTAVGPLFLTAKLKNISELEPGKIYTIAKDGIIFDENDLTEDPNKGRLDAEVTVTLATWDKVEVDVEL